jgi:hypothetical protein
MNESLARLSASFSRLSSAERWFIIIMIIVLFAVVNFVFILPRLNDWGKLTQRMSDAQHKKQRFEDAIGHMGSLSNQIARLEGASASVPAEDQAVNFLIAVQQQANQSQVQIATSTRQPERTNNQFFIERAQSLSTLSDDAQLVDFLYNLGAGSSQVRVRSLSLSRDPSQTRLRANMTLVASFQKKPAARAPTATPASAPAAAPAPAAAAVSPPAPNRAAPPPAAGVPPVRPGATNAPPPLQRLP